MTDPDQTAREAARLLATGAALDLDDAMQRAAELARAPLPARKRVRAHLRAMTQQALGAQGYEELVKAVLESAEEVMTALEATDGCPTRLVGRAARAEIDGGVTLHIRAYTRTPIGELAALLVACGYDEPTFETAESRHGRLSRLRFADDGLEVVVTRCPPDLERFADRDLFADRVITALTLEEVRARC